MDTEQTMPGTTDPVLALRISLDSPNTGATTTASDHLNAAGFRVESVSPRGLLIAGAQSLIERFFDTRIDLRGSIPQFREEPTFGRLPGGVGYRAYFPREPTFF